MMTDSDLQAIEARCNKAAPGPWKRGDDDGLPVVDGPLGPNQIQNELCEVYGLPDEAILIAEFIAHARADVPALIAEVRRLRAELASPPRTRIKPLRFSLTFSRTYGIRGSEQAESTDETA